MDQEFLKLATEPFEGDDLIPNNLAYTTPLFIQHAMLLHGRDLTVPSASGTFVKYGGRHYVVTCRHVLDETDHDRHINLAIMIRNAVFNLSNPAPGAGSVSSVLAPKAGLGGHDIDIAIANIDHCWDYIVEKKGKKAIDLDQWVEPDWADIQQAAASGWLNHYKEHTPDDVVTKGVTTVMPVASTLSAAHPEFTMFATEAHNSRTMLSGISGGVIFMAGYEVDLPIGIVFEGYPGGPESLKGEGNGYAQPGDLMVRGHLLSPEIFAGWLNAL